FPSLLFGQREAKYWIFGGGTPAHIEFSYSGPLTGWASGFTSNPIVPPPSSVNMGFEGATVVNDPDTGELLFYTSGNDVYNANHNLIISGLGGNPSSTQAVQVSVLPVCPFDRYYIFSNPAGQFNSGILTYAIYNQATQSFDLTGASLPGPFANANIGEGMLVIPSKSDPLTYWLVTQIGGTNTYPVYKIDPAGIQFHNQFNFGVNTPVSLLSMAYSPVREEIAFAFHPFPTNGSGLFVRGFNSTTGNFDSNAPSVNPTSNATFLYDVEYSPDGSKLYYSSYKNPCRLFQFDFNTGTHVQIVSGPGGNSRCGGLKLGPDGFVYFISQTNNTVATPFLNVSRIRTSNLSAADNAFIYEPFATYTDAYAFNLPEFAATPTSFASPSADTVICPGDSAILQVTGGASYVWSPSTGLSCTQCSVTVASPVVDTRYYVAITDSFGCTTADSVMITLDPNACINSPTIPTVSQWGLILFALLILCIGGIVIWRRRMEMASV
ncbi:MAG: IPTL-CTERM sorting domain-containing protein, partial [Bacteroidota bacterium]